MRGWIALIAWSMAGMASAAAWPTIESIRFEGNRITRDHVIARELSLEPGDVADPDEIERNRQAVMDLGLFREVLISTDAAAGGGVDMTVKVREKRYLLPVPRLDTNSDGDLSYGAQLRWSNVRGLNHRLNLVLEQGRYPNGNRRQREREVSLSYTAPFLGGSDWTGTGRIQALERVRPVGTQKYHETFHRFEVLAIRDLTEGRPRRGWRLGGGVFWEDQGTDGEFAPPAEGRTTALVGVAAYDDLRFDNFSESGRRFDARLEHARDGWGSDYTYQRFHASYFQSRPWGERDHQTWHVLGLVGARGGGPQRRDEFTLGGSSRLRGYDSEFLMGDRVWYGSVEWLRPLGRDWLRGVVMLEAGGTDADRAGLRDASPFASVGVGVRMRVTWFVDLEIEAGIAYPLRGDGGARFFAGGH